jgi:hypothetical protein
LDANTPYQIIRYAANKNQNGNIRPDDYNLIINQGQRDYMKFLIGEVQGYVPGRPIAKVELGNSQRVMQSLAPFIGAPSTVAINGSGIGAWPSDMEEVVAMYTTSMDRIRYAPQDSTWSYRKSVIDPVATNPIYNIIVGEFEYSPVTLGSAKISYVKTPPNIVWAYTLDVNGRAVYDAGSSVAPIWSDTDMMEVIVRALRLVGINLQSAVVSQYATEIKTIGQ